MEIRNQDKFEATCKQRAGLPDYIHTYNRTLLNRVVYFGLRVAYGSGLYWLVSCGEVVVAREYDLETALVLALEWLHED